MHRMLCVIGLLSMVAVVSPAAQQIEHAFVQWDPSASLIVAQPAGAHDTLLVPRRDHRYEGLAFGGIIFAGGPIRA